MGVLGLDLPPPQPHERLRGALGRAAGACRCGGRRALATAPSTFRRAHRACAPQSAPPQPTQPLEPVAGCRRAGPHCSQRHAVHRQRLGRPAWPAARGGRTCNHRGGEPGFVQVRHTPQGLELPDYPAQPGAAQHPGQPRPAPAGQAAVGGLRRRRPAARGGRAELLWGGASTPMAGAACAAVVLTRQAKAEAENLKKKQKI